MIWGMHISRAVYAAAELGIADLLAEGPVSAQELARVTRTHEPSLYRVLRLLAALGVFDERYPRSFGLTVLGDRLRTRRCRGHAVVGNLPGRARRRPAVRAHPRHRQDGQARI